MLMPMNPVRPEKAAPKRKQMTRYMPSCWNVSAIPPPGLTTLVAVKKIRMASGTMIMAMARNWRPRNASAPSCTARAISFIFGVP